MRKIILIILLAFFVAALTTQFLIILNNEKTTDQPTGAFSSALGEVPISQEGYEKVDVALDKTTVYLTSNCRQLKFDILEPQAYSITAGVDKKIDSRPMTHDLMKDMMDGFGIKLLAARIDSYEGEIFHAKLIVNRDNKVIELDSRPSDALAVSVREDVPFYVKTEIMDKFGLSIC